MDGRVIVDHPEQMNLLGLLLRGYLEQLRREGERYEDPLDVGTLMQLSPAMGKFASFPTDLDFLMDHPGKGLTWVGTYGPLSRFDEAAEHGVQIMVRHGVAPAIVSRAMKVGRFGVLRFLAVFDKQDADEIARLRAMNLELLRALTDRGFVMYKTPAWALRELLPRLDPGMVELLRRIKGVMDPAGIMNPGKLLL